MRKLTKGFLIFGVVSTILGFIMIIVGAQSNGIQSLLAMSKDPVYDNRIEEVTFGSEVEKLDLTLEQHSLTITESVDDKIHITYHPSVSGRHDLTTGMSDKTLSVTDKQASQHRFLGSGIEGLLRIASSYSHRFDEVIPYRKEESCKLSPSQPIVDRPLSLMLALKMRPSIQTAISSELKEVVLKIANSQRPISSISLKQN